MTPTPNRRWFKFSLWTLFVAVMALACWMGWSLDCVRERERIMAGPEVTCGGNGPTTPAERIPRLWLAFGASPTDFVTLPDETDDAQLAHAKWLFPEARVLRKSDCGAISMEILNDPQFASGERPPYIQVSLGAPQIITASQHSATADSKWIRFPVRLTNRDENKVWVYGYSANSPFYKIYVRPTVSQPWRDYGVEFCATGAAPHCVESGKTEAFAVAVPASYSGQKIKVTVAASRSENESRSFEFSSDPVTIP